MKIDFTKIKTVHFIGIGGIGISAIARMMLAEGVRVSGSDVAESKVTEELRKCGAEISIGQGISLVPKGADLIVYSNALLNYDPKFFKALQSLQIPMRSYPEVLGKISAEKFTIAIAGTHGKTTTTAMTGTVLKDCGLDPTIVVGSILAREGTNFVAGKSKYLVVEADEYRRAFLNLSPRILAITNIDADHLDYFKDIGDIISAFGELVAKIPKDGFLVVNSHAPNMAEIVRGARCRIADWSTILAPKISLHGAHNVANAKVALAVAKILGVDETGAWKSLSEFRGTWRRFEYKGKTARGALVYDDYAHNPAKVRAALAGAREAHPKDKIRVVFQPHLFSRTKSLLAEFAKSFGDADEVVLLPIYAAREHDDGSVSSEVLAAEIKMSQTQVSVLRTFEEAEKYLTKFSAGDVIITMGAGDITTLSDKLISK